MKDNQKIGARSSLVLAENESPSGLEANFKKQLEAWKENSFWVDQAPEIKVLFFFSYWSRKCKIGIWFCTWFQMLNGSF